MKKFSYKLFFVKRISIQTHIKIYYKKVVSITCVKSLESLFTHYWCLYALTLWRMYCLGQQRCYCRCWICCDIYHANSTPVLNCAGTTAFEIKVLQFKSKPLMVYRCDTSLDNSGESQKFVEAVTKLLIRDIKTLTSLPKSRIYKLLAIRYNKH